MNRLRAVSICATAVAFWISVPIARAMVLENAQLRVEIDDHARIVAVVNKLWPGVNLIGRPADGFWRLNLQKGRSLENIVWPEQQTYKIEKRAEAVIVNVPGVVIRGEKIPVQLVFRITLSGDEIHWSASVTNHSGYTIAEVFLPDLGGIAGLGEPDRREDLYWPEGLGRRISNFPHTLTPRQDNLTDLATAVNRLQNPYIELTYPAPASMAWCTLNNGDRGVSLSSLDSEVLPGAIQAGRRFSHGTGLYFSFVKYPFIAPQETWTSADYVTSFYQGDWHVAADRYRTWLKTWRKERDKPAWVRNLQGMFLVIMRQQYGDVLWKYQDVPWLFSEAQRNGLDTIALFGWTEGGHDNQYPEYRADPAMGGPDALRNALKTVTERHGNSILYLQGHLIDPTTPEYPGAVKDYAARNIWGTPYYEQYAKFSESSFLRNFSRKSFSPACPAEPGWAELLEQKGRDTMTLGPTGIIYDQIGGMVAYPCFNPGLKDKPPMAFVHGRLELLRALRSNLRKIRPDAGFMAEHPTDVYSQYLDIVHCAGKGCSLSEDAYPELFRYTLPDVIVTARHPATRPIPEQVNYALAYGLRFEIEVRYREEGDDLRDQVHVEMSEYLRKVSELRKRHWSLLGTGELMNCSAVHEANPNVTITMFGSDRMRAVVTWNQSATRQMVSPALGGFRLTGVDGIEGPVSGAPAELQPHEIRVWIFKAGV